MPDASHRRHNPFVRTLRVSPCTQTRKPASQDTEGRGKSLAGLRATFCEKCSDSCFVRFPRNSVSARRAASVSGRGGRPQAECGESRQTRRMSQVLPRFDAFKTASRLPTRAASVVRAKRQDPTAFFRLTKREFRIGAFLRCPVDSGRENLVKYRHQNQREDGLMAIALKNGRGERNAQKGCSRPVARCHGIITPPPPPLRERAGERV